MNNPVLKYMKDDGTSQAQLSPKQTQQKKPTGSRLIDKEHGTRTRPMKVIMAGMSRTGTFSMYHALKQLDLKPYHMAEAMQQPSRDLEIAQEALKASRLGEGTPYGREEFDKWIGGFDAICDVPLNLLVPELTKAYPDAKVVLTTRDPAKWRKSIEETVLQVPTFTSLSYLQHFSADCSAFWRFQALCTTVMKGWTTDALAEHNALVRATVPPERLLEFTLGRDGWGELCAFLGVGEVPQGAFPHVNDAGSGLFGDIHGMLRDYWAAKALGKFVLWVAPVVLVAGAVWYQRG